MLALTTGKFDCSAFDKLEIVEHDGVYPSNS